MTVLRRYYDCFDVILMTEVMIYSTQGEVDMRWISKRETLVLDAALIS